MPCSFKNVLLYILRTILTALWQLLCHIVHDLILNFNSFTYSASCNIPSNSHISTPFFRKTVVFSKICLGSPPYKVLEVYINSEYMWYWSPVYIFNSVRALKSYFLPVSKLPPLCQTPTHRRIYLCKSFHSDMPNFDTVLLNKQNWCKSKYDIWVLQHKIPPW